MDTSSVTSTSSSSKESNDSIVPPASSRRANGRGVASSSSYQSRATTVKTSKYRGVSFLKGKGLWRARIEFDGKRMHLGCFKNEDDAARKYDEKSYELHGQKGVFNFPDEIKLKCAVSSTTSSTTTTTTTKNVSNTTTSSPPVTESRALSPPSLLQRSMSDSAISSSVPSPVQQQQQQQLHQQYAASALSSLNRHQNNFDFISNDQLLAFSTADLIVSNDRKKSRARDDKDSSNSNDSSKAAPLKRQRRATPLQLSSPDCETQIQQILVKNTNATNTNQDSTTTASTNTIASKMQCPSKGAIASAVAALAAAAAATTIPATSPATISSTTISSGPLSKPSFNSDRTASNTIPAATPRIQISPSDSIMSQFSKISPSAVHPSFLSSYLPASSQIRLLNNNNCNTNTNTNNNNGNGNCNPNINNGNSNNNSSNHGNNSNSNSKNQSPSLNQLPDSSHFQMSILSSPLGTSMLHSNGLFAAHNQLRFPPSPMDSSKYCTTFLNPYMASASTSPLNLGRSVNLLNPLSAAGSLYFQDPSRYPLPRSIPVSARANNGLEYCQSTSSSNQQHLINSRTLPSQSAQSQESNSN